MQTSVELECARIWMVLSSVTAPMVTQTATEKLAKVRIKRC